jgi:hypothetical protein
LRDICLAAARIFGWDGKPQTEVNITNQVGIICDEATRQRLIELRERITLNARQKAEALPATMPPPEPVAKLQANVGAPTGNLAGNDAAAPDGPCSIWSAPAATKAPGDASPVLRAWLEHEAGPEYDI